MGIQTNEYLGVKKNGFIPYSIIQTIWESRLMNTWVWKGLIFGGQGLRLRWVSLLPLSSSVKSFPFDKMTAGLYWQGGEG